MKLTSTGILSIVIMSYIVNNIDTELGLLIITKVAIIATYLGVGIAYNETCYTFNLALVNFITANNIFL